MTLTLRKLSLGDFKDVLKWRKDPQARKMFKYTGKIQETVFYDVFLQYLKNPSFMACLDDKPIGYVQLSPINTKSNTYEIGINLNPTYRGRGLGTEILKLLLDKNLPITAHKIVALIKKENIASFKMFTKLGFLKETNEDIPIGYFKLVYHKK